MKYLGGFHASIKSLSVWQSRYQKPEQRPSNEWIPLIQHFEQSLFLCEFNRNRLTTLLHHALYNVLYVIHFANPGPLFETYSRKRKLQHSEADYRLARTSVHSMQLCVDRLYESALMCIYRTRICLLKRSEPHPGVRYTVRCVHFSPSWMKRMTAHRAAGGSPPGPGEPVRGRGGTDAQTPAWWAGLSPLGPCWSPPCSRHGIHT